MAIFFNSNQALAESNERVAVQFGALNKTLTDVLENERLTRDRVDISLAEYERLKKENKSLHLEVMQLSTILERINFPVDVYENVRPESISVHYSDNPRGFIRRYRIEFEVEDI